MLEPSAQTDKSLRVLQDDFAFFFQTLCHLNGDPRSVQEDAASHLGMISVKSISNYVDGCRVRLVQRLPIRSTFRPGYYLDFPAGLYFQLQFLTAVSYDLAYRLFQIPLARSDQQHVVHIPQIMRNKLRALTAPKLVHILCYMMVELLQIEIGKPLTGICPDGKSIRNNIYQTFDDGQDLIVFQKASEAFFQLVVIDVLIEFPYVEFGKILCLFVVLYPSFDSSTCTVDASSGNTAV